MDNSKKVHINEMHTDVDEAPEISCGKDADAVYEYTTDELLDMIFFWGQDKGLHDADPGKQIIKLGEEFGELQAAFLREKEDDFEDAIGDMVVVLVNLCAQMGIELNSCIQQAWDTIKGRKGKMIHGVFVKEKDLQLIMAKTPQ